MGLGLFAIAVGVLQSMYEVMPAPLGWSIISVSSIGAIILVILGIHKKGQTATKDVAHSKKTEAHRIHSRLIKLETGLWSARDIIPKGTDPRDDTEVKKVFSNIQAEANNLATLVNNSDFEKFVEALLSTYSRFLQFNANPYKKPYLNLLNRVHRMRWSPKTGQVVKIEFCS